MGGDRGLCERLFALPPLQRNAIDILISLFELSAFGGGGESAAPTPDDEDIDELYLTVYYNENDITEARRIAQYGITRALSALEQRPQDTIARSHLLCWQLRMADLDMATYFASGDQAYRRNAVTRYGELARILDRLPQTYRTERARDHALTYARRLETIPHYRKIDDPDAPEEATRHALYVKLDDFVSEEDAGEAH